MAVEPIHRRADTPLLRVAPFQDRWAGLVASWVRDDDELYELAPRLLPPMTAAKVRWWQAPGRRPRLLYEAERANPIGYGELNLLGAADREYWLGHIIIDPAERGRGLGVELVRQLMRLAFVELDARIVSLVVFPSNAAAVACYRAVGLRSIGLESHYFKARARRCRLLRMALDRDEYEAAQS